MKLSGLFSIVAFGCLKSAAALRGAPPRSLQESPDLCASIIAIALTRDPSDPTQARHLSSDSDEEFVCERADTGEFLPLVGTADQIKQLRDSLNYGEFVSAETTIVGLTEANLVIVEVPGTGGGNTVTGDSNGTAVVEEAVSLPLGALEFKPGYGQHSLRRLAAAGAKDQSRRHLATYLGDKKVLFVKVTDKDGLAHPDNAATISDKIFGTYGDTTTMTSQFSACSFGKMTISNNRVNLGNEAAAPGVIEVIIDISLVDSGRNAIKSAAVRAAEAKLGYSLPGPFDHVMFGLEKCYVDCGWAAYGGVNSWFTVYAGNNYKFPAVAMHEFGHNLNLAHSGDGIAEYKDHSCLMGNPWFRDDVSQMCFNPAKNYQIGVWYSDKIDFWDSGNTSSNRIVKKIIGIADYGNNPQSRPVLVKLESGTENDLFIGFNRKQGINSASKLGNDLVTVIEQGRDGNGYSKSVFLSGLGAGQSYTKSNWQGSGKNMVISVISIDSSSNPWTADVEFNFNNDPGTPPPPTPNPAPLPTTLKPTLKPVSESPTRKCGNGICEIDENANSCSADCFDARFFTYTDNIGAKIANGTMFTVQALRDVEITDIWTFIRVDAGNADVEVYTRPGSYNNTEGSDSGWDLLYRNEAFIEGQNDLTEFAFNKKVKVLAGQLQSFYVYSPANLKYRAESVEEGVLVLSDQSFKYFAGIAIAFGKFGDGLIYRPRIFSGALTYIALAPSTPPPTTAQPTSGKPTAQPTNNPTSNPITKCGNGICDANENSSVCAVDCSGLGLGGAPEAPNGAEGIMFRVKAVRHLTVTSFDVYGASSGVSAFRVYTRSGNYNGYESNQDGWTLSYNTTSLQLNGRYTLASLGRFSEGISIPAGTEKSFYLYTPSKLMYAPGYGTSPSSSNGDLELYEGTGVYGGIFANTVAPRVFAGMIRYDISAASPPTSASPVTASPTSKPSNAPSTASPVTASPTKLPSRKPTLQPTNAPSGKPTSQPTNAPSKKPTVQPSKGPTKKPTVQPTNAPSKKPTITSLPTKAPTKKPTAKPTVQPSKAPTKKPTVQLTISPSKKPTITSLPTKAPTKKPTAKPTVQPSKPPTKKPTVQPSKVPTKKPVVQPTNAPTRKPTNNLCGNNICEGNEDSSTCSSDCQGIKLPANSVGAKGADGAMFYVKARGRDISIRSFDIFTSFETPANTINSVVQVYTRPGQFRGYELSVDGWTLVYNDSSIDLLGQNSPTSLGDIDEGVIIPANQYQSFLIYTPGSGKVMYSGGTSEGTQFSNDTALEFYEGVGMVGFFSGIVTDIYSPRVFRGAIQYDIITIPATCGDNICEENESTAVCPSDCRNLAFETNDIAANGADGAMFTIKALRDIKITSLDFFGGSTTTDLVQVYTRQGSYIGHELLSNSWNLMYNNNAVEIKGRYDPTSLGNFDTGVFITKNSVQSFYVYSPTKVMYSPGTSTTSEGYLFKYNDAIAFYEGIGVNGQFSTATLYRPRVVERQH